MSSLLGGGQVLAQGQVYGVRTEVGGRGQEGAAGEGYGEGASHPQLLLPRRGGEVCWAQDTTAAPGDLKPQLMFGRVVT